MQFTHIYIYKDRILNSPKRSPKHAFVWDKIIWVQQSEYNYFHHIIFVRDKILIIVLVIYTKVDVCSGFLKNSEK